MKHMLFVISLFVLPSLLMAKSPEVVIGVVTEGSSEQMKMGAKLGAGSGIVGF